MNFNIYCFHLLIDQYQTAFDGKMDDSLYQPKGSTPMHVKRQDSFLPLPWWMDATYGLGEKEDREGILKNLVWLKNLKKSLETSHHFNPQYWEFHIFSALGILPGIVRRFKE